MEGNKLNRTELDRITPGRAEMPNNETELNEIKMQTLWQPANRQHVKTQQKRLEMYWWHTACNSNITFAFCQPPTYIHASEAAQLVPDKSA